jgi:hypothetical protein
MGVKHVETFDDSLLVVQQVTDMFQYFDGSLNAYLDKCLEIIDLFDDFIVQHVFRDENTVVNDLAQQASGFWSNRGKFGFLKKSDVPVCQAGQFNFQSMRRSTICFAELSSSKPDGLVSEIRGSKISRTSDETSETMTTVPEEWRTPLMVYCLNTWVRINLR